MSITFSRLFISKFLWCFQMKSPTHHKSPTVAGTPHLAEYESTASSFSSFPQRPQSTIFISHTAPMTIPEGKSAPVLSYHEATKLSSSPLKSSPEQFGLEAQVSTCTLCIYCILSYVSVVSWEIILWEMSTLTVPVIVFLKTFLSS